LKCVNRLYDGKVVYEKASITFSKFSNSPYNLIFTTQFNDASIFITIISCDYLNLSLVNEYVGDVTIPTQVIKYNQNALQADQPFRLQYSNQSSLYKYVCIYFVYWRYYLRPIWWTSKVKENGITVWKYKVYLFIVYSNEMFINCSRLLLASSCGKCANTHDYSRMGITYSIWKLHGTNCRFYGFIFTVSIPQLK
jgi:hypothetical protein